jgi:hypothetical protein
MNTHAVDSPPRHRQRHQRPTTTRHRNAAHRPTSSTREAQQGGRARRKLCRRSPNEEPTTRRSLAPPPTNQWGAAHRELQGGLFKKRATQERRTAQSENLGLLPGAPRRSEKSCTDAFKKGTMLVDVAVASREDTSKSFPSARLLRLPHRVRSTAKTATAPLAETTSPARPRPPANT